MNIYFRLWFPIVVGIMLVSAGLFLPYLASASEQIFLLRGDEIIILEMQADIQEGQQQEGEEGIWEREGGVTTTSEPIPAPTLSPTPTTTPTPTPAATSTPTPTPVPPAISTPAPTATPAPIAPAEPTLTATPAPTRTPELSPQDSSSLTEAFPVSGGGGTEFWQAFDEENPFLAMLTIFDGWDDWFKFFMLLFGLPLVGGTTLFVLSKKWQHERLRI